MSKKSTSPSSFPEIGSDLAKVDAYVNTAADLDEIPDMSDRDAGKGHFQASGVPKLGRPPLGEHAKEQVTLRLDRSIIAHFKSGGPGWQARMNDALAMAVEATKNRPVGLEQLADTRLVAPASALKAIHAIRANTSLLEAVLSKVAPRSRTARNRSKPDAAGPSQG